MDRTHGVVTAEDLKVFFGVPFNNVAIHHVHKLVQVKCSCNLVSFFFLILLMILNFFSSVGGKSPYYL